MVWSGANAGVDREEKRSREHGAPTGSGAGEASYGSSCSIVIGSEISDLPPVRPGHAVLTGQ